MKDVFLSMREFEVFNLLVASKTSREIASILHISPKTVETYVEKLFNKFQVDKRVEIIAKYYREDITVKVQIEKTTKREKIQKLLNIYSSREIAKQVGCSPEYVREVRAMNKQLH